jgi:CRISPR/Cas system-associated exonuclease Cas4 (RecB family)
MVLIEKIDNLYSSQGNSRREWDGLHASSIGNCVRAIYFEATLGKNKEFEPRVKRIFDTGNSFHQKMMRVLYRIRDIRVISAEIPIIENELIKGTCDALVSIDNDNYVIDFKSINTAGFNYLTHAKIEHRMQVLVYMHYFKISKGLIVYEDKDTSNLKEFVIDLNEPKDKELLDITLERIRLINEMIKLKQIPEKPKFSDDEKWKCNYCSYKEECKKNE